MAIKKTTTGSNTMSAPSILTVPESEGAFDRTMREVQQTIAKRAYHLCEQRGFTPGNELDDWLRAESELFRPVPVEFSEDENELKVVAEVPGYTAENIELQLEPTRLVIRGNTEREQHRSKGQLSYTEREANEIFRAVHLPVEVDPEKSTATVRDGMLDITLPKTQNAKVKRLRVQAA